MTIEWYDGIQITVEAGFSAAVGSYATWDASLWNTGTWGPDTVWTDISQWVRHIRTSRKFSRDLQAWEAGEATISLRNDDGRFCPHNMDSPYVIAGESGVRPWRPIRIKVNGTPIYTGYSMAWNETYERAHATSTVTVPCRDELAALARVDGFETEPVGSGEMSGLRIHRILNNAGHTGERAVDVGRFEMQSTTLAQNTVAELKLTADSEGGALWVEADGSVWFSNRYKFLEETRSNTVQATFGDGTSQSVFELPCMDIATATDTERLVNLVSFARTGGTAQVVGDNDSRALNGDKTYRRHDLINVTDQDVAGLAELYIAAHKDAEMRIESITFAPRRHSLLLANALNRRVRDRVAVFVRPQAGHIIDRECFISGISHDISQRGEWTVTFDLDSSEPWSDFTSSLWDTAIWDTSTWFY